MSGIHTAGGGHSRTGGRRQRPKKTHGPRRWVLAGGVLLTLGLVLAIVLAIRPLVSAAHGPAPAAPATSSAAAADADTVTVGRRTITVVVTLDATVVASPTFTVNSPSGTIRYGDVKPGRTVAAGTTLFLAGGKPVTAPVAARFDRWLVPDGDATPKHLPVARLTFSGFGIEADVPPEETYRLLTGKLTAKAEITNGPGPFECPVLVEPLADGADQDPSAQGTAPVKVVCAVPPNLDAIAGASGLVALRSGQIDNALAVPLTAVNGTREQASVYSVAPDGRRTAQTIGLGATDGTYVQVTSGLREGEEIAATPPTLADS